MFNLPDWMRFNRLINVDFSRVTGSKDTRRPSEVRPVSNIDDINCVTSEVVLNGSVIHHMPVLDIDVPHFYAESTTPGHAHLVLGVKLSEKQYGKLLDVLNDCGIIQDGVIESQWKPHRHTAIRLPGVKKKHTDAGY